MKLVNARTGATETAASQRRPVNKFFIRFATSIGANSRLRLERLPVPYLGDSRFSYPGRVARASPDRRRRPLLRQNPVSQTAVDNCTDRLLLIKLVREPEFNPACLV